MLLGTFFLKVSFLFTVSNLGRKYAHYSGGTMGSLIRIQTVCFGSVTCHQWWLHTHTQEMEKRKDTAAGKQA